jgi:hypothetical protein
MSENKDIIQRLKPMTHKDCVNYNLTVYYQIPAQNSSHRQVERLLLEES